MMKSITQLSDDELKAELIHYGYNPPPITGTTRGVLQKKLESFRAGSETISKQKPANKKTITKAVPATIISAAVPPSNGNDMNSSSAGRPTRTPYTLNDSYGTATKPDISQQNDTFDTSTSSSPYLPKPINPQQPSPRSPLRMFSAGGSGSLFSSSVPNKPISTQSSAIKKNNITQSSLFDSFGGQHQQEEDDQTEDDHMESSRIISPRSRYRPSVGYGGIQHENKPSPMDKVRNFGRSAWGFFSRPLGTSTPCSDTGYKYTGYATSPSSKYRRYTSYNSGEEFGKRGMLQRTFSSDNSRLVGIGIFAFIAVLATAYVFQAHTESVHSLLATSIDLGILSFNYFYNYAIVPLTIFLCVSLFCFSIYKAIGYYRQSKADKKRHLIELVERITDIIYESGSAGIAEPHVRDMLMPPTKRTKAEYERWQTAARFINNEDSRIRTEIRLIDGTECSVWIWIGAGKQRWQGTAVAEGSPMAKVPEHALTRCLKLRGVDFTDNIVERGNLRKELLNKLKPIVPLHLGFVNNNAENVVYIMLRDLEDAKRAFLAFHSHWFNGNMITVKYVRDERYLERFPDAGQF